MVILLLSCTDSKTAAPEPGLIMGGYKGLGFEETRDRWNRALAKAFPTCKAGRLYKGGYWATATRARVDAALPMRTLVVSAGLGLVDVQDRVPSYAATFTPGTEDSIPGSGVARASRRWWYGLGGLERFQNLVVDADDPRVISAMPQRYLDAAQPGLMQFVEAHGADRLVVLGTEKQKRGFPGLRASWVDLDLSMVHTLGGTAGQLTARTLRWVCDQIHQGEQVNPAQVRELVAPLANPDAPPLYPKRARRTPEEVRAWIVEAWADANPPTSATGALRRFRDEGNAFEQKHFGRLYRSLLAEQGGLDGE